MAFQTRVHHVPGLQSICCIQSLGLLYYHSRRSSKKIGKQAEDDLQIEWTEAEVYSTIDLDLRPILILTS